MYKIIFTLLLCCCATAYGAEVDNALLKKNLEAANLQIEVLKAQVEVMKSYQDKFLSTVYWSLGTVAALVVFLAGFNWFTNNRNAEKESALHKEMITNELNSIKNNIGQQISDLKQNFLIDIRTELDSLGNQLLESNELSRNELELKLSTKFHNQINQLKDVQKVMQRELWFIEYDKWMNKGVFANAMHVAADLLAHSEDESEYITNKAFDKINETLDAMRKGDRKKCLVATHKVKLTQSMKPFYDKYKFVIDNINRQLEEFEAS